MAAATRHETSRNKPGASVDPIELRMKIATFFRGHRQSTGLTLEDVVSALACIEVAQLQSFESGEEAIPLDLIFSLTNLYNIPPEDTLNLIHDVYGEQGRK